MSVGLIITPDWGQKYVRPYGESTELVWKHSNDLLAPVSGASEELEWQHANGSGAL